MESTSVWETVDLSWDDEADDEEMKDARQRGDTPADEGHGVDDEEAGDRMVLDLSQDADESEAMIDLSQDDGEGEGTGGSPRPAAEAELTAPRFPATARVTELHAALAVWLGAGSVCRQTNCQVPQHEQWWMFMRRASRAGAAKVRALDELHGLLVFAQNRLVKIKDVADESVQRLELEIKASKRSISDNVQPSAALAQEDRLFATPEAYKRELVGPLGDRLRFCEYSRDTEHIRVAEAQAKLTCISSLLALIDLERLTIQLKGPAKANTEESDPRELLIAGVASDMDVYAAELETRWALAPADRTKLLAETAAFWGAARFWLPEWVRELAAKTLERLPITCAKQVLVGLACDLHWSQALAA